MQKKLVKLNNWNLFIYNKHGLLMVRPRFQLGILRLETVFKVTTDNLFCCF